MLPRVRSRRLPAAICYTAHDAATLVRWHAEGDSAVSGASGNAVSGTWPADVIHVNEDGWVLINRGERAGVAPGMQLLVVGSGVRDLRNLFAAERADGGQSVDAEPIVLRIRRTYEQLMVVYAEAECAVAVATRTPPARRPSFYRGPDGELLVWVPLPEGYTYPPPDAASTAADGDDAGDNQDPSESDTGEMAPAENEPPDMPPETGEQDDKRWEEALPLNGVSVGDLVVPAVPVSQRQSATAGASKPDATSATTPAPPTAEPSANPFDAGQNYDWLKSGG
jgi:hypothetical protein